MKKLLIERFALHLVFICMFPCCNLTAQLNNTPYNIVVIMADDLGYSDLECYGSEIATPNINALAANGFLFTGFYTAATCSPSRAMLLSGTDHHLAGFGNMAEQIPYFPQQVGKPGYEGYLNNRVTCIAQLLRNAGYHTYMAGKWHLGETADQSPYAKGFEKSFALMGAYSNHFNPALYGDKFMEDDRVTTYPAGQYSSEVYTNKLIGFLEKNKNDGKPFFMYAAYTAPHWPLQAPAKHIEKYKGQFAIGYDSLRQKRFQALKHLRFVNDTVQLPPLPAVKGDLYAVSGRPLLPWTSLPPNERIIEERKMEIYAGMIDNLDENIGRLISYFKEIDVYDNTLIVVLSDNGAAVLEMNETPENEYPLKYMGTENSFVAYGPQWAHASSAVNSFYKGYSAEGGIHSPMIIKLPAQQHPAIVTSFCTIMDLAPTFLDVAGIKQPEAGGGNQLLPFKGNSLLPYLQHKTTAGAY